MLLQPQSLSLNEEKLVASVPSRVSFSNCVSSSVFEAQHADDKGWWRSVATDSRAIWG